MILFANQLNNMEKFLPVILNCNHDPNILLFCYVHASFMRADLVVSKDVDFYEMFSGCGTLYKEFRPMLRLNGVYINNAYSESTNTMFIS